MAKAIWYNLDYWLEHYCKTNLKYNTIEAYKTLINKYIKPELGKYRMSTITSQSYLKHLYENSYKYYHLEDVKNEYGKVVNN